MVLLGCWNVNKIIFSVSINSLSGFVAKEDLKFGLKQLIFTATQVLNDTV